MEAQPAGSLLSFLAAVPDPQPAWPTTSPFGRSRVGVLRHHVWREELHRHCAMGTGPRYWADASTWLHTPTSKDGRDSKGLDRVGPESLRGSAEPVGRIVAGPASLKRRRRNQRPSLSTARQLVAASTASRRHSTYSPWWLTSRG